MTFSWTRLGDVEGNCWLRLTVVADANALNDSRVLCFLHGLPAFEPALFAAVW